METSIEFVYLKEIFFRFINQKQIKKIICFIFIETAKKCNLIVIK